MERWSNSDSAEASSSQLDKGLDILELLVSSGHALGLGEIGARVGGPKATVHRLIRTLQSRGYVAQDPRSTRYSAGLRCFELGSRWAQNLDLRAVAAPHLAELNLETEETVHLAVYEHGDVVYIDKIESRLAVVAKSYVGRRCPAACVATGRALLAFQPREEIAEVLARPLPAYTPDSVTEPGELEALLARIRHDGVGVNHGSFRTGVGGVAAPIRDHTGGVIASVGLCLPELRFGPDRFDVLRERTVQAATTISAAMGGPTELVTDGTGRAVAMSAEVPGDPSAPR
ncbi:MAG TPA: IclR family transcriptional regulator [Actinomycetospora sp.]|jgi:DNA-binding IclR family transcriptional regulator|uniref:IclR family transcriptional regulator n=1 Tax=Actinomycetospora sp. TaxID=1872135 RepID=UPI002F3ED29B